MINEINIFNDGFAIIGKGMVDIPVGAYQHNSELKCVQIADGVVNIRDHAFSKCAELELIIIPSSVNYISESAFEDCNKMYRCFNLASNKSVVKNVRNCWWVYQDFNEPSIEEWTDLLSKYPSLVKIFDSLDMWGNLQLENWLSLLRYRPIFARQFEKLFAWNTLSGNDWVDLLCKQPCFSEQCSKANGWEIVNSRITNEISYAWNGEFETDEAVKIEKDDTAEAIWRWLRLIKEQPQFAAKCDEYNVWELFDGLQWAQLLMKQPQLCVVCERYCGWEKIHCDVVSAKAREKAWRLTLEECSRFVGGFLDEPQCADDCKYEIPLDDRGWRGITRKQPNFIGENWGNLSKTFLLYFIQDELPLAAQHFERFDIWQYLDKEDWQEFVQSDMRWLNCIATHGGQRFWKAFLPLFPSYISDILSDPNSKTTKKTFWQSLLSFNPVFIKECADNPFSLTCEQWKSILNAQPQFLSMAGKYMSGYAWFSFLCAMPEYMPMCEVHAGWSKFTGKQWSDMLLCQPEGHNLDQDDKYLSADELEDINEKKHNIEQFYGFIVIACDMYHGWQKLSKEDWLWLLYKRSQFIDKLKLEGSLNTFGWQSVEDALKESQKYCKRVICMSHRDDIYNDYDCRDVTPDWREESGWNDVYGEGLDMSDIIEFRD